MGNWDQVNNGGKGSKRRAGANDKAYSSGWDRIFGDKNDSSKKDSSKESTSSKTSK